MSSRSKTSLDARMAEKSALDARALCYVRDPSVEECLVLDLASEIHQAVPDHGVAVSWAAQEEAVSFYNEHGFIEALTRMTSLRARRRKVRTMKLYIIYVDGEECGTVRAASHNAAERKAQAKYPGRNVSVAYTEV
jgi:hypothetical protein